MFLVYLFVYSRQQGLGLVLQMTPKYAQPSVQIFPDPEPKWVDSLRTYTWYNGSDLLVGKEFNVSDSLLESMGLPFQGNFTELTESNVRDFVFVTATNYGHF